MFLCLLSSRNCRLSGIWTRIFVVDCKRADYSSLEHCSGNGVVVGSKSGSFPGKRKLKRGRPLQPLFASYSMASNQHFKPHFDPTNGNVEHSTVTLSSYYYIIEQWAAIFQINVYYLFNNQNSHFWCLKFFIFYVPGKKKRKIASFRVKGRRLLLLKGDHLMNGCQWDRKKEKPSFNFVIND